MDWGLRNVHGTCMLSLLIIRACFVAVGFLTLFIFVTILVFLIFIALFTSALMKSERDELVPELPIFSCDLRRAGRTISSTYNLRSS